MSETNILSKLVNTFKHEDINFNAEIFKALTRSNAIAILDPQGHFIEANEKFAKIYDFSVFEIINKHHSFLLTNEFAKSAHYKNFWNDLHSNRFVAGEFERKSRLGETVWISGSYNPITNKKGEIVFIIKFAVDITEQKQLALDIEQQHHAVNKSNLVVQFDLNGNIISANENFCRLMSYEEEELVNFPHKKLLFPKDINKKYDGFWKTLKGGISLPGEFRRKTRLGKEVWIRGSYNPVFDHNGNFYKIIKYAIDVTAEKTLSDKYESQLKAIERSNAIVEFSIDGIIQKVNENFLNIIGYTEDELIGHHHSILLNKDEKDSESYNSFWNSLRLGEFKIDEFKRINRHGEEVWIRGSYNPILNSDGEVIKVIKYALDVTEHKETQEALLKDQELIHSQAKMAALGQMAAGIAHEINNPLSTIFALTEELEELIDSNQKELIQKVDQVSFQTERIKHIIASLKALISNDEGKFVNTSIVEVIQSAFKLAQNNLITNKIEVDFELEDFLTDINKTNTIQILMNLISNSIYALKDREGKRLITIRTFFDDEIGYLYFEDNGPGIAPHIQNDIFNPFFTSKGPEGTGLGLALAKKAMEQANGYIELETEKSNSCFKITFKLKQNRMAA